MIHHLFHHLDAAACPSSILNGSDLSHFNLPSFLVEKYLFITNLGILLYLLTLARICLLGWLHATWI